MKEPPAPSPAVTDLSVLEPSDDADDNADALLDAYGDDDDDDDD
jgi:hypothetical protein